jgi:hypothetical protein
MARIAISVRPLHPDGTVCTHKMKPSGKAADPGASCAGRRGYEVHCSSHGRVGDIHGLRVNAEDQQTAHRSEHAATPAGAHA